VALLAEVIARRGSREWTDALEAATVPCGPINDLDQVFADPQVVHRGMRMEAPHSVAGTVPLVRSPMRLSETPPREDAGPPALGQHTREVLVGMLGMSAAEVEELRARGVV
jgi:formyl-CoA transferase